MTPGANVVRVDRLSRTFGSVTALKAVSFRVSEGELFGVVGPDGAGKTTLLRVLSGVLPPGQGEVEVVGWDMRDRAEEAKPSIAYMPQRFGLYEDLTVEENLVFYADLHRVPRGIRPERIAKLYRFSGLHPFRGRLAGDLSGGMKQKLGLSCCLVHEPPVLLLDEPTFGVDPISRRDLWLILHEEVASGTTVVVSTSYMDEAERCDRVLLLDGGEVMDLDTPDRLLRSLPGALVAVTGPELRRARDVLGPRVGDGGAALFGDRLHVLIRPDQGWPDLAQALEAAGVSIDDVSPVAPSLEDVFLNRMTSRSRMTRGTGSPDE